MINASLGSLEVSDQTVWLSTNRNFGNMVPGFSDDWEAVRGQAVGIVRGHTDASHVIRMRPPSITGFVDLDYAQASDTWLTDGLITSNPEHILHANPADCGEIALHGVNVETNDDVIALLHASRRIVGEQGHVRTLEYLQRARHIDPTNMTARFAPSARVESYAFAEVDPEQVVSPIWRDYVYEDDRGMWHIDFHARAVDDLLDFGIPKEQIQVNETDTIADPNYFSYFRQQQQGEPAGYNGLFFALRR